MQKEETETGIEVIPLTAKEYQELLANTGSYKS